MGTSGTIMADFVVPAQPQPFLATPAGKFPVHRIYCVGRNYYDHGIEMGGNPDREPPFFFMKPSDSAVSAQDFDTIIPYPSSCEDFHYECEMIVGIGEGGSNIPVEEALNHVYGYSVGVDLTRRDLQKAAKDMRRPWDTSKGFDLSAPCGLLIPVKERGHVREGWVMEMTLNGNVVQKTELRKMIWKVDEMISYLSSYFRLQPGDLIMTGTPAGVGKLVSGDRVECHVTGLPPCRFTVGEKGSPLKQADKSVRRIVTGHDDQGQAVVLQDSTAPNTFCPPMSEGGAVFRVIEFSPEGPWIDKVKRSTSNWLPLTGADGEMRHPLMHRSETIDYGVVVSGEIVLMLDNEEVELKAGDVFVQRGTNHAWSNRSNLPCRIAFVLVTAKFENELKEKF